MADAVDCSVEVRESGKVASYFLTVWEPPIDWAHALAARYPDLRMALLYAEEGEGFRPLGLRRVRHRREHPQRRHGRLPDRVVFPDQPRVRLRLGEP
jgi:hypothetical protein